MSVLYPFSRKILPSGGDITILGSTGTIGIRTLEIISDIKKTGRDLRINVLTAGSNYKLLAKQAKIYNPKVIAIANDSVYNDLKYELDGHKVQIFCGDDGVITAASRRSDYVMASIVGTAGLLPTLTASYEGNIIALANKECLVSAGRLFLDEILRKKSYIFPIDSEHNALYHLISHGNFAVKDYYITASGGAFRDLPLADFSKITPKLACTHPNWNMGAKISVDSATMMNKGLEIIEASLLFDIAPKNCHAILHPQSLVHAMVRNGNGELLMLASKPDMGISIFSSLCEAYQGDMGRYLDPLDMALMDFKPIDENRYPLFYLAKKSLEIGGIMPLCLNAINEIAVEKFLNHELNFVKIYGFIADNLEKISNIVANYEKKSIDDILVIDRVVRKMLVS